MIINFQQGIISYPVTGSQQSFLTVSGGYVSLNTANGRTDITFGHGPSNYLLTESADVTNAWGPLTINTDTWLYWDLDARTAVRTFGMTTIQPQHGASLPGSGTQGQHFFATAENKMYVYDSGAWRSVVRVFAAKINNNTFTPLGTGVTGRPFAGTQVGVTTLGTAVGRILIDDAGKPIRRSDGRMFTTEDDIFTNGSPVNTIRLEANVITATALENLSRYQVVRLSQFGKINVATYYDLQASMIAVLMEDLTINATGTIVTQGTITNPAWNFSTVGALLWIDNAGVFVETDPHLTDVVTYPVGKPPVARVITPNTIFFDQGLGGKGDKGEPGPTVDVIKATAIDYGIVRLNIAADDAEDPIAVSVNDPRMTNPRAPLSHTQPATTITFQPYLGLIDSNVQLALQTLYDSKVGVAGDTMTGYLFLHANPTLALHAATKQYVDAADALKLNLSGGTMTGALTLGGDPTLALHAATKQYVDARVLDNLGDVTLTAPTNGQVLSFNGTSWVNSTNAGGGLPAGNTTEIQYNNAGAFGASNMFAYDAVTGRFDVNWNTTTDTPLETDTPESVTIRGANSATFYPGSISMLAGQNTAPFGSTFPASGGDIFVVGGAGSFGAPDVGGGSGGGIFIQAGAGGAGGALDTAIGTYSGPGGNLDLRAGDGGNDNSGSESMLSPGHGGNVDLIAGNGGFGKELAVGTFSGTNISGDLFVTEGGGVGGNVFIKTGDAAPGGVVSGQLDLKTGDSSTVSWFYTSGIAEPAQVRSGDTGGIAISTGSCAAAQVVLDDDLFTTATIAIGGTAGNLLIEAGTGGAALIEAITNIGATGESFGGVGGTVEVRAGQGGTSASVDGPAVGGNGGNVLLTAGEAGPASFSGTSPDSGGTGTAVSGDEGSIVATAGRHIDRPTTSAVTVIDDHPVSHYRYFVTGYNLSPAGLTELSKNTLPSIAKRRILVDAPYNTERKVTWVVRGKYIITRDGGVFESGEFGATLSHDATNTPPTTTLGKVITRDVAPTPVGSELFKFGFEELVQSGTGSLPNTTAGLVVAVDLGEAPGGVYEAVANVDILEFVAGSIGV